MKTKEQITEKLLSIRTANSLSDVVYNDGFKDALRWVMEP